MQTLKVDGMTCSHCERAVAQAIQAIDPEAKVQVDREAGLVTTDSHVPAVELIASISLEGYEARAA